MLCSESERERRVREKRERRERRGGKKEGRRGRKFHADFMSFFSCSEDELVPRPSAAAAAAIARSRIGIDRYR